MRTKNEIAQAISNNEEVPIDELIKFFNYGELDAFFGNENGEGGLMDIINKVTGDTAQDKAAAAQKELQEDAQDFAHNERIEQNDWEYQLHKMQLLNDPVMQLQGLKAAGLSDNAAMQAILGSQGSFGVGAASNGAAPMGSVSPVPPQGALADVLTNIPQKIQDVRNAKTSNILTKAKINECNKNTEYLGQQISASKENIQLAKKLNESQIGLNGSVVLRNFTELEKLNNEAALALAKAGLVEKEGKYLDSQSAHEWALASLTHKQATKVQQEIDNEIVKKTGQVLVNQAGLYSAQDKAQAYENYGLYLRNQVAKTLGYEPDADIVTQVMEAIVTGNYSEVGRIIGVNQLSGNSTNAGALERAVMTLFFDLFGVEKSVSGITK